jgi:hypothetical protein
VRLRAWSLRQDPPARGATLEAIQALAKASYQPSLLKAGGAPKAGGGSKKKISGGCG